MAGMRKKGREHAIHDGLPLRVDGSFRLSARTVCLSMRTKSMYEWNKEALGFVRSMPFNRARSI